MATRNELTLESAFNTFSVGEQNEVPTRDPHQYKPAILRNRITGKRQEILLLDPADEKIEQAFLQDLSQDQELHHDMLLALEPFSAVEKRIIFRVLLQGQSVQEAAKRTRQSSRTWERWLRTIALPHLRTALKDYEEDLARLGVHFPADTVIDFEEDEEATIEGSPANCNRCSHVAASFHKLKHHVREKHLDYFHAVQSYAHENDHSIMRQADSLHEVSVKRDETEGD